MSEPNLSHVFFVCISYALLELDNLVINWMFLGEILRMTHIARGLDSDGALLLDIVVNGHILQLPSHADISIKVQEQNYT